MLECTPEELDAAIERFESELVNYDSIASSFATEIAEICAGAFIPCRTDGRAKDPISYYAKVIKKGYNDPWEQVTDKAGARVILETASDVDVVTNLLSEKFGARLLSIEDKRQIATPESLGYSGVHIQAVLTHNDKPYECEIQVRTAAQDLWSTMSHKVLYKPTVELPTSHQHAAYRLVAIMELFDEELERIMHQSKLDEATPVARIASIVAPHYLRIARSVASGNNQNVILEGVLPAFDDEDLENYNDIFTLYLAAEEPTLRRIYQEHGPSRRSRSLDLYPILSYPESLIILERLSCKKHKLVDAWQSAGLPYRYLTSLADIAGVNLPSLDQ